MSAPRPSDKCQRRRMSFQYSYHFISSPGLTKNCISICSNSRILKMNCLATISFRKAFPVCAMPKGTFIRPLFCTFRKFTKIPWAVSGLRKTWDAPSPVLPSWVLNIRLNWRTSVQFLVPDIGQTIPQSRMSWRNPARSFSIRALVILSCKSSILACSLSTLGLVARNWASSNCSPNRF